MAKKQGIIYVARFNVDKNALRFMNGDVNNILPALGKLRKGESVVYHTGLLVNDRSPTGRVSRRTNNVIPMHGFDVPFVASHVMKLAKEGKVNLFQRKVKDMVYEYFAVGAA